MKLRKPKPSEMCPPGEHIVRGYERRNHSGTISWVETHLCKNPGKGGEILWPENIFYLFWNSKNKYSKLGAINGFPANSEIDPVIQFWMDYWKDQGLNFPDADPLLFKALIAVESRFNPNVKSKVKGSSASGLMQVTDQMRRILSGGPDNKGYREVTSNKIRISKEEIFDPLLNVAIGTRCLFYKYSKIPGRADKNIFNAIKNYHSWDEAGENYAKKVTDLFKKSK